MKVWILTNPGPLVRAASISELATGTYYLIVETQYGRSSGGRSSGGRNTLRAAKHYFATQYQTGAKWKEKTV